MIDFVIYITGFALGLLISYLIFGVILHEKDTKVIKEMSLMASENVGLAQKLKLELAKKNEEITRLNTTVKSLGNMNSDRNVRIEEQPLITEDAKKRREAFAKGANLNDTENYTKEQVADSCRDAVANFARKILAAKNTHNELEMYSLLECAIRCSTIYDDEDDDDFWD